MEPFNPSASPAVKKAIDERVAAEVSAVEKPRREILHSIHESVFDQSLAPQMSLARTEARVATLLVSLSEQADRLQRWLIGLTVVIAILTLILVFLTAALIYNSPKIPDAHPNSYDANPSHSK